jgi:threonine/homoserine/homoserine lactone efflux protein
VIFLRGCVLGFAIAAPVGPIGVLCIRRTLAEGGWRGFVSGLGAANADAVYGLVAGLGVEAMARLLLAGQIWIRGAGALYLLCLAVHTWRSPAASAAPEAGPAGAPPSPRSSSAAGAWSAYATTFLLTLTNPMTILSFAALFGAGALRGRLRAGHLVWVNRLSAAALAGFAVWALVGVMR